MGRRQQPLPPRHRQGDGRSGRGRRTMSKPGVVLKRPAGSNGRFAEHAELPDLDDEASGPKRSRRPDLSGKPPPRSAPRSRARPLRSSNASRSAGTRNAARKRRRTNSSRASVRAAEDPSNQNSRDAVGFAAATDDGRALVRSATRSPDRWASSIKISRLERCAIGSKKRQTP